MIRNGFAIELAEPIPGGTIRAQTATGGRSFRAAIASEVAVLLKKRAIERVRDYSRLCLSPVFIVPKRSGKARMILNLKAINRFIQPVHFRMETLATILPLLRSGDWAVSVDLADAYHHVPIAPQSQRLLGFSFSGRVYRYRALPFGLSPAPRVFTRLVSAVAAFLRERGIRVFCYLDDWLIVASNPQLLISHRDFTLNLVQNLGFIVNWEKSSLIPTQHPTFLGAEIDLPGQLARPSSERVGNILAATRALRARRAAPARTWMQLLGYMASLVDVLPDCRLHMRPLQIHLLQHYRPNVDPLSRVVPVVEQVRPHLAKWLRRQFLTQGKRLRMPQPEVTVTTDASLMGWGAVCSGHMVSGVWPSSRPLPHINLLEFRAVLLAGLRFQSLLEGKAVLFQTDNVTVAAYINKQGGTHSIQLNRLAAQFWDWCHASNVTPIATYLPGQENLIADFLSRGKELPSEWTLHPQVMNLIKTVFPHLQIDLFASSLNFQLPHYCSRSRDPAAWKVDAFSFHWGDIRGFAFPPIALIPRILRKVREDRATIILIAPWWPRRPWFPELVSLLSAPPRTLPIRPDVIRQPVSLKRHKNPTTLHLTAWPLSGRIPVMRACPPGRRTLSPIVLETRPENPMTRASEDSSLGARINM